MLVAGAIFVLLGQAGLYALWPSPDLRPLRRFRPGAAAGSVGLVVAGGATAALAGGVTGLLLVLAAAMVGGPVLVLAAPLLLRLPTAPEGAARRGRLRHRWTTGEGWVKAVASLVGGFAVFVLTCLWFPLVLPELGLSMEAALALATLLALPGWVGLTFACLCARRPLGAVAWVLVSTLVLGVSALLPALSRGPT